MTKNYDFSANSTSNDVKHIINIIKIIEFILRWITNRICAQTLTSVWRRTYTHSMRHDQILREIQCIHTTYK